MLEQALREPVLTAAAQSVTQEQIDAYVHAHPRTEPEQRTLRIVVTTSDRAARRALAALKRGATWRTVGGRRTTVTRAELPARIGRVAFTAQRGALVGPIRSGSEHYVIKITEVEPEHPTPLKTQNAAAWEVLASEAQQNALTAYETALTDKWRPRTICAPDLAAHRDCGTAGGPETG